MPSGGHVAMPSHAASWAGLCLRCLGNTRVECEVVHSPTVGTA